MAIPWMQIMKWMPSIVQVSRELMRRTQPEAPMDARTTSMDELVHRILKLEENERRQAELINQMAEQLAQFSQVLIAMRQRLLWLSVGLAISVLASVAALVLVLRA